MTTRWSLVQDRLENQCTRDTQDLKDLLVHLYWERGLSLEDLSLLTKGEASKPTLAEKLRLLRIPVRSKGGPNYVKLEQLTLTEYMDSTINQLAKKYNVSRTTISSHTEKFIKQWGRKRGGRPRMRGGENNDKW